MRVFSLSLMIIGILLISRIAMAQGDEPWCKICPAPVFDVVDINIYGALDMTRDYSQEYSGETMGEAINNSLHFTSPEGHARVFNVLSSAPAYQGFNFASGTHIGFDSLGTTGQLIGGEGTNAVMCAEDSGRGSGAGFSVALDQGQIHSNVSVGPSSFEYDLSGSAQGKLKTGAVTMISTSNGSKESYSQSITLNGEFTINHGIQVNFPEPLSGLCPWNIHQ